MPEQFKGKVEILSGGPAAVAGSGIVRITLDGNLGSGTMGGNGEPGNLFVMGNQQTHTINLDGKTGAGHFNGPVKCAGLISNGGIECQNIELNNSANKRTIHADGEIGAGFFQKIVCTDEAQNQTLMMDGVKGNAVLGANGTDGVLKLNNRNNRTTIHLDAINGSITGNKGQFDELILHDKNNTGRIGINGDTATVTIGFEKKAGQLLLRSEQGETIHLNGSSGTARLGGHGVTGDMHLFANDVTGTDDFVKARINLDAANAAVTLGGNGVDGDLVLFSAAEKDRKDFVKARINLDAANAAVTLGGNGADGDLVLFSAGEMNRDNFNKASIHLDAKMANIWVGGNGADGDIALFPKGADLAGITNPADRAKRASIHLDGEAGDIVLRNADCAEEFCVAGFEQVEPGSVLVIASENELVPCSKPYDKRVAGIVSGAGNYKPGILLDKQHGAGRLPVALMGKVYCKVEASENPVEVGDLLTTSHIPGYAMKAADPLLAIGAIIGKALKPLSSGSGLIPVLVSLQ